MGLLFDGVLHWSFIGMPVCIFCCAIEQEDNELLTLEVIHRYVELLDKYFGSVSFCIINLPFW
jgi:hypothetical protein